MSSTSWKRTHNCGELRLEAADELVTLNGWVHSIRDHGKLYFIDLRDRWGLTQLSIDSELAPEAFAIVEKLRTETVITVHGKVAERPTPNPNLPTGAVEILVETLGVLGPADIPPFEVSEDESEVNLDLRLKYRFLDLRKPSARDPLVFKARVLQSFRSYFFENEFLELETPMMTRTTPEGAREFVVPSRLQKGSFYALAQSPQIFKQLFMCAGFDRYAQVVRCFRDEDFRADRQPEFTQLDMEMSFVDEEDVYDIVEGAMKRVFKDALGIDLPTPIRRLTYHEAMERYGSDKPDLRFGMELFDFGDLAGQTDFKVFRGALDGGGAVKGICVKGGAELSRKQVDALGTWVGTYGAKGLAWMKLTADGASGPIGKFFEGELLAQLKERAGAEEGDLVLAVADPDLAVVYASLGHLRIHLAKERGLIVQGAMELLWVTDFPLLEWDADSERYLSLHHPFTSPSEESLTAIEDKPGEARARAYDLVLNGSEVAGGSIRIHRLDVQKRVFQLLGMSEEEATGKFGFLLEALRFGAPPHGGIAFGLDRIAAVMQGLDSIRDVIPFPKAASGVCPLTDAPASVEPAQLEELGLALRSPAAE